MIRKTRMCLAGRKRQTVQTAHHHQMERTIITTNERVYYRQRYIEQQQESYSSIWGRWKRRLKRMSWIRVDGDQVYRGLQGV